MGNRKGQKRMMGTEGGIPPAQASNRRSPEM